MTNLIVSLAKSTVALQHKKAVTELSNQQQKANYIELNSL